MHNERFWDEDSIDFRIKEAFRAVTEEKAIFRFDEVTLSRLIEKEAREGVSMNDAEYRARLDARLVKAGMSFEQRMLAQLREIVLCDARRSSLEANDPRRGDDPACCDPGGGMRSLHEIEDDEQF